MKSLLGFVSFFLIAQGIGGILHHFLGWFEMWGLVHRVGFLDGYEIFTAFSLLVLGVAVGGASDKLGKASGDAGG